MTYEQIFYKISRHAFEYIALLRIQTSCKIRMQINDLKLGFTLCYNKSLLQGHLAHKTLLNYLTDKRL